MSAVSITIIEKSLGVIFRLCAFESQLHNLLAKLPVLLLQLLHLLNVSLPIFAAMWVGEQEYVQPTIFLFSTD